MIYVVAAVVTLGAIGGGVFLAARGRRVDVREWSVGGRRFGGFLFWFLLAGETFTTFSILGASQAVYVDGAPAYYVLGTVVLTSAFGYWAVPRIWRAGKEHGLMTEGDYFSRRFAAPWLGAALGLFGIVALLLYAQIQLTGLALMLQTLFGPHIPSALSITAAGLLVAVFIAVGGMRGAAFGAVVKDILIVVVLLVLALVAPSAAEVSGWGGIFDAVAQGHPDAATLPGMSGGSGGAGHNAWWWMSFLLLAPIGAFVFPHSFQVSFTARDVRTIRRNQIVQPLYSLFYVLVIVIALAALLTNPGLRGAQRRAAPVRPHPRARLAGRAVRRRRHPGRADPHGGAGALLRQPVHPQRVPGRAPGGRRGRAATDQSGSGRGGDRGGGADHDGSHPGPARHHGRRLQRDRPARACCVRLDAVAADQRGRSDQRDGGRRAGGGDPAGGQRGARPVPAWHGGRPAGAGTQHRRDGRGQPGHQAPTGGRRPGRRPGSVHAGR